MGKRGSVKLALIGRNKSRTFLFQLRRSDYAFKHISGVTGSALPVHSGAKQLIVCRLGLSFDAQAGKTPGFRAGRPDLTKQVLPFGDIWTESHLCAKVRA
ncbi:MAG: hypothetical protein AAFN50_07795 [Pseudomonadota bacterium]